MILCALNTNLPTNSKRFLKINSSHSDCEETNSDADDYPTKLKVEVFARKNSKESVDL